MSSYQYTLEEFIKKNQPDDLEEILTFALRDRSHFFKTLITSSPSEKRTWCFEVGIINMIQKYLTKKKLQPVYFSTISEPFTIQRIMISRYNENYVIRLRVDRWLGDIVDHVCEYIDQIYDIDIQLMNCTYRNSNQFRE